MNKGLAIRLILTLLAAACTVYTVFLLQPGQFPFRWETVDAHTFVIEPRSDSTLPPGLSAGDRLDLRQQETETRAALYTNTLSHEVYVLEVDSNGTTRSVAVTKVLPLDSGLNRLLDVSFLLVLVLGLTTLWWGRDWAAWGLSLFALATIVNFFLFFTPIPFVAQSVAVLFNQGVVASLLPTGLYVSAMALAGPALGGRLRVAFHTAFIAIVLATAAVLCTHTVAYIVFGNAIGPLAGISGLLFAAAILAPIAVLLAAMPRADAARRLRMRWILLGLSLFIGALAWNNLAQLSDIFSRRGLLRQAIWWAALLCGLAGLLYAVLRKQVVAMSFAVNRALVYGLVAALVIGVFGTLTVVLENTAIGNEAGLALTVGVSVAIGFVLEAIRDRINAVVERVFFRRRYEAEAALRGFSRECAYIERPERLLDELQGEIRRHVRPDSSAIYVTSDAGYRRARLQGDTGYPERVDLDDRAFVTLRADREPVDLREIASALGSKGYAFPMVVRGVLSGALVCGPRSEEYTRDERRLIAEVAQQAGAALHALRAREHEALVRALAGGEIDIEAARRRALAMQAPRLSPP